MPVRQMFLTSYFIKQNKTAAMFLKSKERSGRFCAMTRFGVAGNGSFFMLFFPLFDLAQARAETRFQPLFGRTVIFFSQE